eukprot:TRINITY_DN17579_c0_g1_i3.p1 TRINITY_DN17579_c0_g1~~TRINITY_DN17579_c0_g1_i3.p1  ORF type:complete len:388 (-),score=50.52 TRINITY_DN17579_c0_g1_i3:427-1590(-)
MVWASSLTGNEQFCLAEHGITPGTFLLGNHVFALGIVGGIKSLFSAVGGGANATDMQFMRENRRIAFNRLEEEANTAKMDGLVGVEAQIVAHGRGVMEFLVTAGGVKWMDRPVDQSSEPFSCACSGEQLSCLLDLGFKPLKLVYGNESYSRGLGGAITGGLRMMLATGEIREYSETFMKARQTALLHMKEEAFKLGANFISGVKMTSMPYLMTQEVMFMGTACKHPDLPMPSSPDDVLTSGLNEQELWSLASHGFFPKSVVMAVSIYNLGVVGDVKNFFQSMSGGECTNYGDIISQARHSVMTKIVDEAKEAGADQVLSLRTEFDQLNDSCVEFFAFATSVVRSKAVQPQSTSLSPQHFCMERTVFSTQSSLNIDNSPNASANAAMK